MHPLLLSIGLLLVGVFDLHAGTSPVIFGSQGVPRSIGRHLLILEDSTNAMNAAAAFTHSNFVPFTEDVPNLQVTNTTYWLKFSVLNRSEQSTLVVSVPYAEIDEIDLYVEQGGELKHLSHTGRSREWAERSPQGSDYHFEILTPLGLERQFLMRVRGFKPIHVPIHISSHEATAEMRVARTWFLGSYAGVMLVLALYNLFVFFSIRDRSYLFYVLYIVAICSAQLTFLGAGPLQVFELPAWIESRSSIFFALLAILLGMEFTRRFIGTKAIVPKLHRIVPVFFVLIGLNIAVYCVLDPLIGYQIAQAMGGWTAIYLLIMASVALKKGSRQAGFFLMAWTAFLLGVVVFVLKDAGVLPFNSLTQYAMPIGSGIEGILLSFGLADRINTLRKEKERSQADALAASLENQRIVREQNVMLEEKVTERTHALQESNEHLKRTQTQLVNAEKMASLGQLTAGIAHEINNPINFITSNIQPLRRNISEIVEVMQEYRALTPDTAAEKLKALKERERKLGISDSIEELDEIIGSISEGSNRTAEIVRGLRNFSRLDEDDLKESDLHEGLRNTLALLAPQHRDKVNIRFELGEIPHVECFPGKVNQVFMNILTNAIQATQARPDGATPEVVVSTSSTHDHVTVTIADNGIGMGEEVKARMFDPFFTTKAVGEGTGLGLAIVYGIVQDHFGHIAVDSTPGQGTTIRVHLPIRHVQPQQQRA